VLSPPPDTALRRNDRSCVLLVSGRRGRLLLTGDITRRVEPAVARRVPAGPPLVLVVPHHGSRTSSSQAFLQALRPRLAIASAGWHNRYGHPAASVVARYRTDHIRLLNTATAGAVTVAFPASGAPRLLARWRLRRRRYWRE
jgi:competence protein ComEC